jgi:histone deacetylase complex regulatory component SIN3
MAAKDLFLQVQSELGSNAMNELASAVKLLRNGEIEDVKDVFVEVLQEQPDLLDRFLAFLPKRYRGAEPKSNDMQVY